MSTHTVTCINFCSMATRILRHRLGYLNEPNTRSKKIPPVIKIGAELILAYPTKDCVLMFDPPLSRNERLACLFEGTHRCMKGETTVSLWADGNACYCHSCCGRDQVFEGPIWEIGVLFPYCPLSFTGLCLCRCFDCVCPHFLRLRVIGRDGQESSEHLVCFVEKIP